MKLVGAEREFISAIADPERRVIALRYQVKAHGETHGFDQELQIDLRQDGTAQAYMQMENVADRPSMEEAVQRLADHMEMMAKALRATHPGRRKVKTAAIPLQLWGKAPLIHIPRKR